MGVGGSTSSRPGSATVLVKSRPPSDLPSSRGLSAHTPSQHPSDSHRPTGSCCSHYRKNHSALTRTVTTARITPPPPNDNIDDDIEEIVANTLDLVSNPNPERTDSPHNERDPNIEMVNFSAKRDRESFESDTNHDIEQRNSSVSGARVVQKRPSNEISEDVDELLNDAKVSKGIIWLDIQ